MTTVFICATGRAGHRADCNAYHSPGPRSPATPCRVLKTWKVRLYRDNRWDICPERQPIEEVVVVGTQTMRDRWLADAIIQQHSVWGVASFQISSVEEAQAASSNEVQS